MPPYKIGTKVIHKTDGQEYTVVKIYTQETVEYVIRKYKIKSGEGRRIYAMGDPSYIGMVTVEHDLDEHVLEHEYHIEETELPEIEVKRNRLEQI